MLTPAKPERGRLVSSEAPRRGTTWDESSRGRLPAVRWRWALVAFALVGAAGVLRMVSHVRARGPAAASPTDALAATQAAAAARRASRNLLSPFEPSCLRTTRARDCPGFEECLGVMSGTPWQPPNPLLLPTLQLPQCSKENCLNRSKCHMPFRVFGYHRDNVPEPLKSCFDTGPNQTLRDRLPDRSRHLVTDDPSRACVFYLEIDQSHKGTCDDWRKISQLPHWHASSGGLTNGGGMNHVLVDFRDELLAAILPWDRKWLATFKGSQSHPIRRTMSMEHDEKATAATRRVTHMSSMITKMCKTVRSPSSWPGTARLPIGSQRFFEWVPFPCLSASNNFTSRMATHLAGRTPPSLFRAAWTSEPTSCLCCASYMPTAHGRSRCRKRRCVFIANGSPVSTPRARRCSRCSGAGSNSSLTS
ncbi:hypothetical protein T492DRAFT_1037875, partial [Pavlovales sp. CCMP2436]